MSDKTFRGGVPTDIEVAQLRRRWPASTLREGLKISHAEIESVTGVQHTDRRTRSIIKRWKGIIERDSGGKVLLTDPGRGYQVATDNQKVDAADSKMRSMKRMGRRALKLIAYTDAAKLDDDHKRAASHIQQNAGSTIAILNTRGPQILPDA